MPDRIRNRAQERADEIDISPTTLLAEIEALKAERDAARSQSDEYLIALQRERAEFLNFKRRTSEDRQRDLGLAAEDLIRKVVALADDFDLAIEQRPESIAAEPWFEGISAIDRKLRLLLDSEGVTPIEALPGTPFDPREHEGIANVPGSGRAEGEVVEQVRRGYRLRDRVLRPALVAVATGPTDPSDAPSATGRTGPTTTDHRPN